MERAARAVVDENGVTLYHHNIDPTENGFWVEAKDLRVGDVFLGANGELTTVVAIERVDYPDGIMVYNFSVDGNHNYFVIAEGDEYGQTSVLVHNASGNNRCPVHRYGTLFPDSIDRWLNMSRNGVNYWLFGLPIATCTCGPAAGPQPSAIPEGPGFNCMLTRVPTPKAPYLGVVGTGVAAMEIEPARARFLDIHIRREAMLQRLTDSIGDP